MRKRMLFGWVMLTAWMMNDLNAQEMERKAPNVTGRYQIMIDAPIDTVWKALAEDFGGIGKWASGVNHVVSHSGYGITATRFCEINAAGFNDTKERVIRFEPENYYFEYDLYEGLPGFVDYSINKEKLEERNGQTYWVTTNDMRVGGFFGLTMKGYMSKKLADVLEAKAHELKYFIETGRQHKNKLAAKAKKKKRQLFVIEQTIDAPAERVWEVIAQDFDKVSDSHPVSPKSQFAEGTDEVKVGAQRIMYMAKNEKKYFVDKIVRLDEAERNLLINVEEAKGYPISFSNVEFYADSLTSNSSKLTMIFSYQMKPRFLQKMAKGSLKKQLQAYVYAIDHHAETGEVITKESWKRIRKNYK